MGFVVSDSGDIEQVSSTSWQAGLTADLGYTYEVPGSAVATSFDVADVGDDEDAGRTCRHPGLGDGGARRATAG